MVFYIYARTWLVGTLACQLLSRNVNYNGEVLLAEGCPSIDSATSSIVCSGSIRACSAAKSSKRYNTSGVVKTYFNYRPLEIN